MRGVVDRLARVFAERDAELQVAFDQLEQLGWPPGRLVLSNGPLSLVRPWSGNSGGVQEILIRRGPESPRDLPVFRAIHEIAGDRVRLCFGWMVPPEQLPAPGAHTLERARHDEARWERHALCDGVVEDERPIAVHDDCVEYEVERA